MQTLQIRKHSIKFESIRTDFESIRWMSWKWGDRDIWEWSIHCIQNTAMAIFQVKLFQWFNGMSRNGTADLITFHCIYVNEWDIDELNHITKKIQHILCYIEIINAYTLFIVIQNTAICTADKKVCCAVRSIEGISSFWKTLWTFASW